MRGEGRVAGGQGGGVYGVGGACIRLILRDARGVTPTWGHCGKEERRRRIGLSG